MENQKIIDVNRKEIIESTFFRTSAEYVDANKKLLGVSATAKILSYETMNGEIKIDLRTIFYAVYRNEDGTFGREKAISDTVETIRNGSIVSTSCLSLIPSVSECVLRGKRAEATVDISGWFIVENNITVLDACMPGIYCKTLPFKAKNVQCLHPGNLNLTYSDESRTDVSGLLDFCAQACVTNVYPGNGSYRIEGETYIRIVAFSESECFSQLFSHSFTTEIPDEKISSSSEIDIDVVVKNADLSLAESDKRLIISDIELNFCGSVSEETETETVVDVFSTTNEISVQSEEVTFGEDFCMRTMREKATSKIAVEDGINELFGALCPNVSATVNVNEGIPTIEGVIECDVLYLNGKDQPAGLKTETPFALRMPFDYKCDSILQSQVLVTGVQAKPRSGSDIDLIYELLVTIKGVLTQKMRVISSLEIGAEKEQNDFAVSLYIVRKGETLWDVAKALNTGEDVLQTQNPDMKLPLVGGEKIILYRELPFRE